MYTIERDLKMKRNTLFVVIAASALFISTALCCRKVGADLKANPVAASEPIAKKVESLALTYQAPSLGVMCLVLTTTITATRCLPIWIM